MAAETQDGGRGKLTCMKIIAVDTELFIRHGTTLPLLNTKWLVTNQKKINTLLGRLLLEALGINTKDLLAATAD